MRYLLARDTGKGFTVIPAKKTLLFDTETHGVERKLIYDLGYVITDRRGNVDVMRRFLVQETITNPDIMRDAFYHRKIYTDYLPMLNRSYCPMLYPWREIVGILRDDVLTHNVSVLSAYNLAFDIAAMRATSEHVGADSVFTYRPDMLCLWVYACRYLFNTNLYREVADREGWKSPVGNYRTTAEHAYRFLTGRFDYTEPHTALEDVAIEHEIFCRLHRKRQRIPYNEVRSDAWRLAQEVKK